MEFVLFAVCAICFLYLALKSLNEYSARKGDSRGSLHRSSVQSQRAPYYLSRSKMIRILFGAIVIASLAAVQNTMVRSSSYTLLPISPLGPVFRHDTSSISHCECSDKSVKDNKLIVLASPWRFFLSAHWFHICEYYIPYHSSASQHLHTNASIFIMAPHDRFVSGLTRITYMLLMVAFTNGAPARVEVVPPSSVLLKGTYASIVSTPGSFIFDGMVSDPYHRFSRRNTTQFPSFVSVEESKDQSCACASVIGEYGSAPIERGYWFRSKEAVVATRERLHRLCSKDPQLPPPLADPFVYGENRLRSSRIEKGRKERQQVSWTTKLRSTFLQNTGLSAPNNISSKYMASKSHYRQRLILYQRNRDRKLIGHEEVASELTQRLGPKWNVDVVIHDDNFHPCNLLHMFRDIDMLLTPHGFQTVLLIFMPQGSAVYEIFPFKYWKDGYRPFANEYGLYHGWSQNHRSTSWFRNMVLSFISQNACMQWAECREYARRDDVVIDSHAIDNIIKLAHRTSGEVTEKKQLQH